MFSQISTYLKPGLVQEKYKSVKKDMNGNPSPQKFFKMPNNTLTVLERTSKRYLKAIYNELSNE